MLDSLDFYHFSPTGGTQKCGKALATALAATVIPHDLASRYYKAHPAEADVALIAVPVFGGRIPALAAERVKALAGAGRKTVTLVVYGNRAYEDALLELNDCAQAAGFSILASGAFIAEHSVSRAVAAGRPDAQDLAELADFGSAILAKLAAGGSSEPAVPGNRPYKGAMRTPATPIFLPNCGKCGSCAAACPTGAIRREGTELVTDWDKCIFCMACIAACHRDARILPPPLQEAMSARLAPLVALRRGNERYL